MACQTGGLFTPIEQTDELDDPTTCDTSNFEAALGNIGALLFRLSLDDDGTEDSGCAGCEASLADTSGPAGLVLVGLSLIWLAVLRRLDE